MRVNGINMTKIATFALTLAMCALFMVPHNVHAQTLGSANVDYSKIGKCDERWPESTCNESRVQRTFKDMVANFVPALQLMAQQLSAVAMQQTMIIGTFFDADAQLDAQMNLETLKAEAHKDYHPSAQMCQFGSFVKSIAHSEERGAVTHRALHENLTDRYIGKANNAAAGGQTPDVFGRFAVFKEHYCDPNDHGTALKAVCAQGTDDPARPPEERERINKDIDYTRTVGAPLTLNIDFTNAALSDDEQDVIELGKNLYWPVALNIEAEALSGENLKESPLLAENYLETRQTIAKHILAHNSYLTQVAMKTASSGALGVQSGPAYMKALFVDFGLSEGDIRDILGDNPSYWAQMDVLTKKMYQDPKFYTNLYDKPANVSRMNASMQAIGLMHYRDRYNSQLRQELLISQMVESRLKDMSLDTGGAALVGR